MNHRSDVQVLRGVAVLLVVLFHLGLTDFGSGFLGVDVFFVISGYLMALMYDPEQPRAFFRRRAWRLLPAYFATIAATLLATAWLATPNEVDQVAEQAWQALTFTSNFWFWFGESYWDKKAFRPLLHLWSLAVEVQFYVLVPLIALSIRRLRLTVVLALALLSALLCFAMLSTSPKTSFFWLPTRLWEFLLGYAVGQVLGKRTVDRRWASAIGVLGLAAIALIPLIPIGGETFGFVHGHPGLVALAVTAATAAVIACGLPARLLSWLPIRGLATLGDASYSVYLAHYPAIVLALHQPFTGTITRSSSPSQLALTVGWVVVTSLVLYRGIEKPLRRPSRKAAGRQPRTSGTAGALGASAAAVATGSYPYRSAPLVATAAALAVLAVVMPWIKAATLSGSEQAIFAARFDRGAFRCGKVWRALHPTTDTCPINHPAAPVMSVFLVGNSHADAIKRTMGRAAEAMGIQLYFTVENYPLMPQGRLGPTEIVARARSLGASAIVLHHSPGAVGTATLAELVRQAAAQGIATSLLMSVPSPVANVPRLMWDAIRTGKPPALASIDDYRRENAELTRALAGIDEPGFHRYEVAELFCAPDCAISNEAGIPYYYDVEHLTDTGSRLLEGTLSRMLTDLLSSQGAKPTARLP